MMNALYNLRFNIFSAYILSLVLISVGPQITVETESAATPQVGDSAEVVGMTNTMTFTPDTVKIKPGETIRWKNSSLLVHSVTADPSESTIDGSTELPEEAQAFDSGLMDPEETFEHTFEVTGTYKYFCIPHEGAEMFGWVIVSDG